MEKSSLRFIEALSFCWFFPKGRNEMGNENTQRNVVVNGEKQSWVIFGLWAGLFWRNHSCNPSKFQHASPELVFFKFSPNQLSLLPTWYIAFWQVSSWYIWRHVVCWMLQIPCIIVAVNDRNKDILHSVNILDLQYCHQKLYTFSSIFSHMDIALSLYSTT